MKDNLNEKMKTILNIYNDPDDVMKFVEFTDYEGNDCFWYLDEYDLYGIFDC
jgi:hypothetical protein